MGELPKDKDVTTLSIHHSMLTDVLGSHAAANESLVYSYGRSFNAFSAKLSNEEVQKFKEMDGVVSVFPSKRLQLHTTRSWDFLGFKESYVGTPSKEGNVIIGMIDSGIWPEAKSFSDEGFGPPPAKWKGICQAEDNLTSIYLSKLINMIKDTDGHGTHTASTAAGNVVEGASFYGLAVGVAIGDAPSARLSVYKVSWGDKGCADADILAAFDDAISDGVDIISLSIGGEAQPYLSDVIAIGSFHAMKKGILTSNSAGNDGPTSQSVSNTSPWSLTVAASSIDRRFLSHLVLGNGQYITGSSINPIDLNRTFFPLIFGGDATNVSYGANKASSSMCDIFSLTSKVKGKIVYCLGGDGSGVQVAGGIGFIRPTTENYVAFTSYPLANTEISTKDGERVLEYILTTPNPVATIVGETLKDELAPIIAPFSSRGRNTIDPDILKPDITAPGVDILAAWSPIAAISQSPVDTRSANFNIISGTSMACPHASGVAAYVKSAHPTWSPAAIKSAIMTTANVMDRSKHEDAEFAYGSGHINPVKAIHPGLVYDASESDYIDYLCKNGYNTKSLRLVTGDSSVCKSTTITGNSWDLNYPSFSLAIVDGEHINGTFTRTVTNVGSNTSTYYVSVKVADFIKVEVKPAVLRFKARGEKRKFTVKISGPEIVQQPIVSGSITWSDGKHVVRSPLIVYSVLPSTLEVTSW
ncbi:hypothetical protein ACHQM5_000826 [Ranunculus cassubicifolius]